MQTIVNIFFLILLVKSVYMGTEIVVKEFNETRFMGENFIIECSLMDFEIESVELIKSGRTLMKSERSFVFTVYDVSSNNDGTYVCLFKTNMGNKEIVYNLKSLKHPVFIDSYKYNETNINLYWNTSVIGVELNCCVEQSLNFTYLWYSERRVFGNTCRIIKKHNKEFIQEVLRCQISHEQGAVFERRYTIKPHIPMIKIRVMLSVENNTVLEVDTENSSTYYTPMIRCYNLEQDEPFYELANDTSVKFNQLTNKTQAVCSAYTQKKQDRSYTTEVTFDVYYGTLMLTDFTQGEDFLKVYFSVNEKIIKPDEILLVVNKNGRILHHEKKQNLTEKFFLIPRILSFKNMYIMLTINEGGTRIESNRLRIYGVKNYSFVKEDISFDGYYDDQAFFVFKFPYLLLDKNIQIYGNFCELSVSSINNNCSIVCANKTVRERRRHPYVQILFNGLKYGHQYSARFYYVLNNDIEETSVSSEKIFFYVSNSEIKDYLPIVSYHNDHGKFHAEISTNSPFSEKLINKCVLTVKTNESTEFHYFDPKTQLILLENKVPEQEVPKIVCFTSFEKLLLRLESPQPVLYIIHVLKLVALVSLIAMVSSIASIYFGQIISYFTKENYKWGISDSK